MAGVAIVSAFTTGGRIMGGWLCDRQKIGAKRVLCFAPLITLAPLMWAAFFETSVVAAQCALAVGAYTRPPFSST